VAEHEAVVAVALGLDRVVDGQRRAAELGQPAEPAVGRGEAAHVDGHAGACNFGQVVAQPRQVGRVLLRVDKALVEEAH
jgi:hypothetical protein